MKQSNLKETVVDNHLIIDKKRWKIFSQILI
jgi:hypothetical protein